VKAWLEKHQRFNLHFAPTNGSWLNLVERSFSKITSKRIRRDSNISLYDLQSAISDYLTQHNAKSKLFIWTKIAETILTWERRAPSK